MQTRSAARKSAAMAQAPPTPSKPLTKEERPEPMVIQHWDHGDGGNTEGISVKSPRFNPIPVERSFNSLFYGSLSSISSSSSGGGSFSSVEDGPMSSPHASFTASQEAAGDLVSLVARNDTGAVPATPIHPSTGPTRVARGTPKRRLAKRPYPVAGALTGSSSSSSSSMIASPARAPLHRDSAINWNSDPVYGASPMAGIGASGGRHRARTASASLDPDDIFQRELQILLRSKELVLAGVKAVMSEKKGKKQNKRPPPQPTPTRTKPSSTRRPLGPEGTELIDESFRAAPAGPSVYPQDWVAHPSNTLHAHPTLPILDDEKASDAMVH
ncbi:hypothetical protein D9619_010644 [Psilocybe cf. subviscida]|uniref:Uncharacterized protein n=1 Tax=Psilocybe cf. subviscida TaxID=2480587 RepID=A0A8H5EZT7_9AGAR|nr:hypothetical protein D9619_010644 [Psilocybe cf. subviscida]